MALHARQKLWLICSAVLLLSECAHAAGQQHKQAAQVSVQPHVLDVALGGACKSEILFSCAHVLTVSICMTQAACTVQLQHCSCTPPAASRHHPSIIAACCQPEHGGHRLKIQAKPLLAGVRLSLRSSFLLRQRQRGDRDRETCP